jgi:hypothetical protein
MKESIRLITRTTWIIIPILLFSIYSCERDNSKHQESIDQTTKEIGAKGVWTYLPAGSPAKDVVGPYTFMTISDVGNWTGTISGSVDDFGEGVVHSSGPWYYKGTVPFDSATVNGKTGRLVISVYGSRPNANAKWEGTWVIIDAKGDLAGLQGQGTWEGAGWQGDPKVPGEVNYSGSIHF